MANESNDPKETINVLVDLSYHNKNIDFNDVKKDGILGIIHKATQGTHFTDNTYQGRNKLALDAGFWWGAYHFGEGGDGIDQAKYFLDIVKPTHSDLLALDFEENPQGKNMFLKEAEAFVTYVHSITGYWPGLYGGSYIKQLLGDNKRPILANCWFWLAQYGSQAKVPLNWDTWTMWQYTDGNVGPEPHEVKGIGPCDRDKFNGNATSLKKLWKP
jgi:lysozyme